MLHGATGSQLEKLWDVVEKGEENNGAEVEEAVVTLNDKISNGEIVIQFYSLQRACFLSG